jgi:hypothetical protein
MAKSNKARANPNGELWGSARARANNEQTQLLLGEVCICRMKARTKAFFLVHGEMLTLVGSRREAVSRLTRERFAEWESARCAR